MFAVFSCALSRTPNFCLTDVVACRMYYLNFYFYFALVHLAVLGLRGSEVEFDQKDFLNEDLAKKTLIVDTDAGSDDAVAILYLLGAEELFEDFRIRLITSVKGNTIVDNVSRNVLKVLKTANRLDIPVYEGANQSVFVTPKVDDYFGKDGFGDFDFPNPPSVALIKNKHAVTALIEVATSYPGQLTLLCLGPLTNIALAIRLDDKFLSKLKEVFILGGSDSAIGNVKPGVEFNFHVDPEAASIVLREAEEKNKTLNLMTWETASVRSPIEIEWRKNILGTVKSPQVDLINKAENLTLTGEHWISSDALLSAAVVNRKIIESSDEYYGDVEVWGKLSRGSLYVDYNGLRNSTKNIRIIKKINTDMFKETLLRNFNPWGGEKNGASKN